MKRNWIKSSRLYVFVFACISICNLFTHELRANENKDTLSVKFLNNTLLEAFEIISNCSEYSFAFNREFIPEDIRFTKEFKNVGIEEIVEYLLRGTGIVYNIVEEQIILTKRKVNKKYTISGFVNDNETGEALFQANIFEKESFQGTVSNQYGYYSLSLPEGSYTLVFSYIGNKPVEKSILLNRNIEMTIDLEPSIALEEVIIVGSGKKELIKKAEPLGKMNISNESIESMPVIMAEPDIVKSIQLIPGIQGGSEGNGDIYVRGGGPLQNLFLLDNVPIYNCFHLLGLFSVFNSDIIGNTEVVKGGFPAKYGGRLSSIVDIKTKEGNMKEFKGKVSLGLISSKLFLEGPIVEDRTSFAIAGRMGYYYIYGELLPQEIGNNNGIQNYNFKDLNVKLTHKFSVNHKLFVSLYTGEDVGEQIDKMEYNDLNGYYSYSRFVDGQKWNNLIGTIGWAGKISNRIFGDVQINTSQYNYKGFIEDTSYSYSNSVRNSYFNGAELNNHVLNYSALANIHYEISPQIKLNAGYNYSILNLNSKNIQTSSFSQAFNPDNEVRKDTVLAEYNYKTTENSGFLEFQLNLWNVLRISPGVHISSYQNDKYKNAMIQPRISSSWEFIDDILIKASYTKMGQHLHLLSATRIKQASDLLVAAGEKAPSEESDQYSLGISYLRFKKVNLHIDAYYKTLNNLINFSEGASYFKDSPNWEDKTEVGKGEAKGIEILLEKPTGTFSGWIGYSYSKTNRKFTNINLGESFPFIYDHRHYFNVVGKYRFSNKFDIGISWLFHSGNYSTIPSVFYYNYSDAIYGRMNYEYRDNKVYYNKKNAYKSPSYHRLDISLNYYKNHRWGQGKWTISVYNLYNRKNVYSSSYSMDWVNIIGGSGYERRNIDEKKLFGIIPSLSYTLSLNN